MESSPTLTAAEVWGPVVRGLFRAVDVDASPLNWACRTIERNMEKCWHWTSLNYYEILTSNWSKCSGCAWQGASRASRASQKFGFGQRGQDAKSKKMQKALWKQVFNSDSLVPGCQMYQSRFGFVLEDLDSINHLDLAQRSKFSKPWNFQLRLQLKLSHATSEQHANICQFKSLVAGCQTRWSYGWEQNPWRYGSRIDM